MRSNGFTKCPTCDGAGFLRGGDFAVRVFPRCDKCGGCGQVYVDPIPPPPAEKPATWADVYAAAGMIDTSDLVEF